MKTVSHKIIPSEYLSKEGGQKVMGRLQHLHKEKPLLSTIVDGRLTKRTRRSLLKELPESCMRVLQELMYNSARGNIHFPPGLKEKLSKHKQHIEQIGTPKTLSATKKQYLLSGNKLDRVFTEIIPTLLDLALDQHSLEDRSDTVEEEKEGKDKTNWGPRIQEDGREIRIR